MARASNCEAPASNQRMADLTPIVVSDVRDNEYWNSVDKARGDALRAWLRSNSLEPNDIYRFEVYLLDTLFAKVFTYARHEDGRFRVEDGELVQSEPFLALLNSEPPVCGLAGDSR
jgi:hypothetical protein